MKADTDSPNWTDARIAEAFHCQVQTIENLRKRLVTEGFKTALNRKVRESPPTTLLLDGQAEARLIALRLGKPPAGYGRWTFKTWMSEDGGGGPPAKRTRWEEAESLRSPSL